MSEKIVSLREMEESEEGKSGRLVITTTEPKRQKTIYRKQRFARIFLYTSILMCMGLLILLAFGPALGLQRSTTAVSDKQSQKVNQPSVLSFYGAEWEAQSFAFHFLSGNIEEAKNFAVEGLEFPDDAVKVDKGVKVTSVAPDRVVHIGGNQYRVIVKAYMKNKKQSYMMKLAVPMTIEKDGRMGVSALPYIEPRLERPKVEMKKDTAKSVAEDAVEEARTITESFFRLFAQGNSNDLGLLYLDGEKRISIPGRYEGLDSFEAFDEGGEGIRVKATGLLNIGGVTTPQTYELFLKKEDGRWKIRKTDPNLPIEQ